LINYLKPNVNRNYMTDDTIKILQQIKNGNGFTLTKDSDDEICDLITRLNGLEIIEKRGKSYFINYSKISLLTQLIKYKDYGKFINWLENKKENQNKSKYFNIFIILLPILISIFALIFGDDLYTKYLKDWFTKEIPKKTLIQKKDIKLLLKQEYIPYVGTKELIDKGLFISQDYANLIVGGANIEDIEISAINDRGEKISVEINDEKNLSMDIFSRPYIEIKYKENYYKIEVYTVDKASTFNFDLTQLSKATLSLKKYNHLK